jgi:competence protein ComGD
MVNNQKGFTLIESLVVLSIFMIISSITAFNLKPQYYMVDDEAFFTQLKADLLFAQQYAISHQHEVTINFMADKHMYYIHENYVLSPLVEREYSPNINVIPGSLTLYFKFLHDGNVSRFGFLYFQTDDKLYRLTVMIGKGRFYVTEE